MVILSQIIVFTDHTRINNFVLLCYRLKVNVISEGSLEGLSVITTLHALWQLTGQL